MLVDPPYVTSDNSTGQEKLNGYLPEILDMLVAGLNFTPNIIQPPDGKFGVELPNGSWNGILGMLHQRTAELALVSFSMFEPRRKVVDYIRPVETSHYGFLIRDRPNQRGDNSVNWRVYTEPFAFDLWVTTAALLVCSAALWTVLESGSPSRPTEEGEQPPQPFWSVLGVLVQQGAFVLPETSSQRILFGSLWVFSVVLFASFTSNIVSLLASTRYVMPFETLEQLAALTDWKIIADPDSADLGLVTSLPEISGRHSIIKALLPDGLEILFTESDATLFTARINVDHVLRRNCSFVWSAIRVIPSGGYLTGQRDLPYRDAIATRLSHLSEAGLLQHLWELTLQQPTAAGCRKLSQFNTMTLLQTAPALALLAVGMLTAALVAFAEYRWASQRVMSCPSFKKCAKKPGKRLRNM
ncbi:Glutamate receptor ionotropic, kainate 2 [Amphibalanus amphitrite]|uniref:Glutamate receptor ionotropic, kainate 2 n=1 Tax=Amphibalanus amphitrite TaxID=1232801 RepID=A0A6A4VHN3_AMPAM|nr:Glutamate receptor ionotropic, kainate 2 [Amphibalanus amphitrite]